jgi:hypothetical protein
MSKNWEPCVISEKNLSIGWAKAFLRAMNPRKDLTPLVFMIRDFEKGKVCEDDTIRGLLDKTLKSVGMQSCDTVANTIFPSSLWNPRVSREKLFERYKKILPRIRKYPKNRHGVYFGRLIAFGNGNAEVNQLEHVIKTYLGGNHRRSALQMAVFDPFRDHTNQPLQGFPCLQHVTFACCGDCKLAINGFYATQYLFERAYGNYLGLCRLGKFVAHELGLELVQMNCTIGIGILDVSSSDVQELTKKLRKRLNEVE